jgi:glycosyltransferase involved in cell wall biosynthesis
MRVSLIVCTRNRATRLPDFLECISSLDAPPGGWELIIVDNGSTDGTAGLLEAFAGQAAFPVRRVYAATPGLARARNAGLAHAAGEIIAFTDDDCYPRRDFLAAIAEVFENPRVGFVGGRTELHDPTDAWTCVSHVTTPMDVLPHSFLPAGLIHGANMAVRREVVSTLGGFDPLLGPGGLCVAADDTDYIARAMWNGWSGQCDPRPVVSHHHGRKPGPAAERQRRGYDYGRGAYYVKFVLDRRSRREYLRGWWRDTSRRPLRPARLRRELTGGARYLLARLIGHEPVPTIPLPMRHHAPQSG